MRAIYSIYGQHDSLGQRMCFLPVPWSGLLHLVGDMVAVSVNWGLLILDVLIIRAVLFGVNI